MKRVLLLGRLGKNIPNQNTGISAKNIELISGSNLEDVQSAFAEKDIDILIMGAGIDLSIRLEIISFVFNTSKGTSVHMKDWNSGPAGMLLFVNGILSALAKD